MNFEPNRYQKAIFDHIRSSRQHAIVNAVAGSGKTSTLVGALEHVPRKESVLLLAYNNHIKKELESRVTAPNAKVSTVYACGNSALRREIHNKLEVIKWKYGHVVREAQDFILDTVAGTGRFLGAFGRREFEDTDFQRQLSLAINLGRLDLIDPSNGEQWAEICDQHDLDFCIGPEFITVLPEIMPGLFRRGIDQARHDHVIDFADMIWIPYMLGLELPRYDRVFVDEAQDLSASQLWIAMNSCEPEGQMVFVGDDRQAVYGFAGAKSDSMDAIRRALPGIKDLPLSISYRCPSEHVKLASHLHDTIEAGPDCAPGNIHYIDHDQVYDLVRPGDYVLSRTVAPLISFGTAASKKRIPVSLVKSDLPVKITKVLDRVVKFHGQDMLREANRIIPMWLEREKKMKIKYKGSRADLADLEESAETLLYFAGAYQNGEGWDRTFAQSRDGIVRHVQNIFRVEGRGAVNLSTIHRCKGLEADRVFLLNPLDIPHENAQEDWQIEQEWNLMYIALTRSKQDLYLVSPPGEKIGRDTFLNHLRSARSRRPAMVAAQ